MGGHWWWRLLFARILLKALCIVSKATAQIDDCEYFFTCTKYQLEVLFLSDDYYSFRNWIQMFPLFWIVTIRLSTRMQSVVYIDRLDHHRSCPESEITTGTRVLPDSLPTCSMAATTSIPETTFPNTTCFPSSHGVSAVQRKNCNSQKHITWEGCIERRYE